MASNKKIYVLDLETTGFAANSTDRIVEIGLVEVNSNFEPIAQWGSLVNPNRDAGPRHIHGIESKWLMDAPLFAELAAELADLLEGSILIAHNASFDVNFLVAEFRRVGILWQPESERVIDTMQLGKQVFGEGQSLKLNDLCSRVGVINAKSHSALDDAFATAELLFKLISLEPGLVELADQSEVGSDIDRAGFESLETFSKPRPQNQNQIGEVAFIPALVAALPLTGAKSPNALEYLATLHAALEDSELSEQEMAYLTELARQLEFTLEEISAVHLAFFNELVDRAWSDGLLTDSELAQILFVGHTLGISGLEMELAKTGKGRKSESSDGKLPMGLEVGDNILLTGDMIPSKDAVASILEQSGLIVKSNISKKVRLVIAGDADSMSGKAREARKLGITVISAALFFSQWA